MWEQSGNAESQLMGWQLHRRRKSSCDEAKSKKVKVQDNFKTIFKLNYRYININKLNDLIE